MYLMAGVVSKLFPLFSGIVLVYFLSPSEYGKSALFISLVAILSSVSSFGVGSLIVREKNRLKEDDYKDVLSSSVFFIFMSTCCFFLVYVFCVNLFSNSSVHGIEYFFLLFFSSLTLSVSLVLTKDLIVSAESKKFMNFEFLKSFFVSIFAFLCVFLIVDPDFMSRIYGIGLGYFCVFILCFSSSKFFFSSVKLSQVKVVFLYGINMLPQIASGLIKMGADKIVIFYFFSAEVLGVYSYSFLVCSAFLVVGNAFNNSATPNIMKMFSSNSIKEVRKYRARIVLFEMLILFIFVVAVFIFFRFFSPSGYNSSKIDLLFLMLSFFLQSIYMLYGKVFIFSNKMLFLGFVNLLSVGFYMFSMLFFSSFGPYFSFFIYSFFLFVLVYLYSKKLESSLHVRSF